MNKKVINQILRVKEVADEKYFAGLINKEIFDEVNELLSTLLNKMVI